MGGGKVVFGGTDGAIYALDARLGTLAWKLVTGGPVVGCPAIAGGVAYIGSSDHVFRAIDMATGKLAWRAEGIDGFVETKPLVAGGRVVFGAWDGRLRGLDAETGWPLWEWMGERESVFYSPAACWPVAGDGKVFVVSPVPWMTAIDLEEGRELWGTDNWAVRESIGISPDESRVYVRTTDGLIAAIAASGDDAQALWETATGVDRDINSAMLVEKDGTVYYGTKNGLLLALDAETGAIKWKHRVGASLLNTATPISGREVVVTDHDGHVTLLESAK